MRTHLKHAVLNSDSKRLSGFLQLDVSQVSLPLQAIVPLLLLQQQALHLCKVLLLLLQLSMHSSSVCLSLTCLVLQLCPEAVACLL